MIGPVDPGLEVILARIELYSKSRKDNTILWKLKKSVLVLAVFGALFIIGRAGIAHACLCYSVTPYEEYRRSDAVFAGTVVSINQSSSLPVTFDVSRVWKGPHTETIALYTPPSNPSCGYTFQIGGKYLVYANSQNGRLQTNLCSGTKPLSAAQGDVSVIDQIFLGLPPPFNLPTILALASVPILSTSLWLYARRRRKPSTPRS